MNDIDLKNPDTFSDELHFALLREGLRGPLLRRLMRLARGDVELHRIYETKVAEFRRFLRVSRKPTLWNLPTRAVEWLTEGVRVTPPREVFMTLVYVVLAVLAVELAKQHASPLLHQDSMLRSSALPLGLGLDRPEINSPVADSLARIDGWMLAELTRVSQTDAWRTALAERLAVSLDQLSDEELLRSQLPADKTVSSATDLQLVTDPSAEHAPSSNTPELPSVESASLETNVDIAAGDVTPATAGETLEP